MQQGRRDYRYYELVTVAFVVVLVCSNLIAPGKQTVLQLPQAVGGWSLGPFGAGVIFFPISYVFGDILTEVYGYSRARKVIWTGFAASIFAAVMSAVVVALPPAPRETHQAAYEIAFGSTWRIVAASMTAYFVGEFFNSFVLAKMKVATEGRFMWARFVGSTICAEVVDSLIFYPFAFWGTGIIPNDVIWQIVWSQAGLKTLVEIVMLPVTYQIVAFLKAREHEDYFDRTTDFNPFNVSE